MNYKNAGWMKLHSTQSGVRKTASLLEQPCEGTSFQRAHHSSETGVALSAEKTFRVLTNRKTTCYRTIHISQSSIFNYFGEIKKNPHPHSDVGLIF